MPITRPQESASGPPLLPGAMGAVCRRDSTDLELRPEEILPLVLTGGEGRRTSASLCSKAMSTLAGYPIAKTSAPSPIIPEKKLAGIRRPFSANCSKARSFPGADAIRRALYVVFPSDGIIVNVTLSSVRAGSATCALVIILSDATATPDPYPINVR